MALDPALRAWSNFGSALSASHGMPEPHPSSGHLWIAPVPARFFLVPEGLQPPPGDTWLTDLQAVEVRADLTPWARYEILEADAERLYREALSAGADVAQKAMAEATGRVAAVMPGLEKLVERLATEGEGALDGPEALALLTGKARAEVEADPEAAREAVLQTMGALVSGTPARARTLPPSVSTAKERAAFVALLQRWTLPSAPPSDPPAASGVRAQAPAAFDADTLLRSLRTALLSVPVDPPETESERQARYESDARAAIDRATAGWKPPMPTVEELLRMGPTGDDK